MGEMAESIWGGVEGRTESMWLNMWFRSDIAFGTTSR